VEGDNTERYLNNVARMKRSEIRGVLPLSRCSFPGLRVTAARLHGNGMK
jgi:hypothetical protein